MAFEQRAARSVLITRPYADATALAAKLTQYGMQPVIDSMLVIKYLPTPCVIDESVSAQYTPHNRYHENISVTHPVDRLAIDNETGQLSFTNYQGIQTATQACIITSKHAVCALRQYQIPFDTPIFVVALTTAEFVKRQGYHHVIVGDGHASSLLPIIARYISCQNANIVYFCGRDTRFDFGPLLSIYRFNMARVILYQTDAVDCLAANTISLFQQDKISAVLFYSPKTLRVFCQLSLEADVNMDKVIAICLSPVIAQTVTISFAKTIAARYPNDDMMIQTLLNEVSHG